MSVENPAGSADSSRPAPAAFSSAAPRPALSACRPSGWNGLPLRFLPVDALPDRAAGPVAPGGVEDFAAFDVAG